MALSSPASPETHVIQYTNLKGCDFSKDITQVDRWHSPDCLNMISDEGGDPVKRLGWRKMLEGESIIDFVLRQEKGLSYAYVLTELALKKIKLDDMTSTTVLNTPVTDKPFAQFSKFVQFKGDMLLFTEVNGSKCVYDIPASGTAKTLKIGDGAHLSTELENVKIPEVVIQRQPDGTGGLQFDDVSLMTRFRTFSFCGDATTRDYYLYPQKTRNENAYKYLVGDSVHIKCETENGTIDLVKGTDWNFISAPVEMQGFGENGTLQTFTLYECSIRFTTAHAPILTKQDNIFITFIPFDTTPITVGETTDKPKGVYYEKMNDMLTPTASAVFGHNAVDRCFIAGGINLNNVYFSDVDDFTYFPDLNYITVGQSTNGITGFHRVSSYLMALKDDASEESTAFLIKGYVFDEGGAEERTTFSVIPMTSGIGALAPNSFATLGDEPLFLSRTGIYGVTSTYTDTEKNTQNRSGFINNKLLEEPNLNTACAVTWNNYYILCVNDHAYVLDGRQQTSDPNNGSTYFYEGFYWENIPATIMRSHHGELWFLNKDGSLCKFNTDIKNEYAYCDNGTYENGVMTGGDVIVARWATKLDEDYRIQYQKTMTKKGALITIKPYVKTSVDISFVKDGITKYELETFHPDISSFDDIDFDTFTVSTSNIAQDKFFKKKLKKYKRLQIIAENRCLYEAFGILEITKSYTINNLAKK